MEKKYILDLEPADLEACALAHGEMKFRGRQLLKWIYGARAEEFSAFSDLPLDFRAALEEEFSLRALSITGRQVSALDGTARYTFRAADGLQLTAVFLPQGERNSVCVSTQIGCSVGCYFCASGCGGFTRNLSRGEIIEQVLQVERDAGAKISGVLLMGMGEPMLNYRNVVAALRAIVDPAQLGIGRRHVTVSTAGYVPRIRELAEEGAGVRLAVSLHAPDDETRSRFIPDRVPYSVREILDAGAEYARKTRSRLTVEYILAEGVNDSLPAAKKLVRLMKDAASPGVEIQVNLIPYNPVGGKEWVRPRPERTEDFREYLVRNGVLAIVREPKGIDIGAACGQLGVK